MMIFNPIQANYLIKRGAKVLGAGTHWKTHKMYIFFDKEDKCFNDAMLAWVEQCKKYSK